RLAILNLVGRTGCTRTGHQAPIDRAHQANLPRAAGATGCTRTVRQALIRVGIAIRAQDRLEGELARAGRDAIGCTGTARPALIRVGSAISSQNLIENGVARADVRRTRAISARSAVAA